jgi:hypothetical protein
MLPEPEWQQGWLDAMDAFLQLLDDVDRGLRDPEEVRPALEEARLRVLRGVHNSSVPNSGL